MVRGVWISLVLLLCFGINTSHAAMPSTVRVDLFQTKHPSFNQIRIVGPVRVLRPVNLTLRRGVYTVSASRDQLVLASDSDSPQKSRMTLMKAHYLTITSVGAGSISLQPVGHNARRYPGRLELSVVQPHKLRVVNELPVRDYVTLVVGSETPPGWHIEALKAQAVLTQTRLARYHPGDALSDTTQAEAYLGDTHRRPDVSKAVALVWGQRLVRQGVPVTVFYHASCAGHTSDTRVFGQHQRLPGIVGLPCTACKASAFAKPTTTIISRNTFYTAFPAGLPQVLSADEAGRPLRVRFTNGKTESGYAFWLALGQKLGWDKAPGLRFSWVQAPNGNVQITSSGAGHGVGLCQQGAAAMARHGKNYRQILGYYFPQAQLSHED
jgi:stage II sporulation protein D